MSVIKKSFDMAGTEVAYWEGGAGPIVLLLHGSGPGASTMAMFKGLIDNLTPNYHVFAMDLIGFGESGRKSRAPFFDMTLWTEQCLEMVRQIGAGDIHVLGHSLSGVLALKLAGVCSKISGVITTGSPGSEFILSRELERAWTYPETREDLRLVVENLVYDATMISEENLDIRMQTLSDPDYKHYFSAMFGTHKQDIMVQLQLSEDEIAAIICPVTLIHGRDDVIVPPTVAAALAARIETADLHILARCAHSVALERSGELLALIDMAIP